MRIELSKVISYIYFFCVLWGVFVSNGSQDILYIATVFFFLLIIFTHEKRFVWAQNTTEKICLFMIFIWIYGVLIGIISGNNITYIFRNFAGLVLFSVVYLLRNMPIDIHHICKFVLQCSFFQSLIIPTLYLFLHMNMWGIVESIPILSSCELNLDDTGYISILMNNASLIFVGYLYCLYKILFLGKIFSKYLFYVIYDLLVILLCVRTGGMEFELLMLTALMIFAFLGNKMNQKGFGLCIIGVLIGSTAMVLLNINPIYIIFGKFDSGNQTRFVQIDYVIKNFMVSGHGLGSEYTVLGKGYAIEVIYLDLMYKLGLFSVGIFGVYAYMLLEAMKLLKTRSGNAYDSMPLAMLGFIFFAFGNPVLFSGSSVLSCVLALIMIEDYRRKRCNNAYLINRN